MEIVAIGADNAAVEWDFPIEPALHAQGVRRFLGLPLHMDFIWNRGAYIIEIMNLDELAKDNAYEFLFVLGSAPVARRHRRPDQSDRDPLRRPAERPVPRGERGSRRRRQSLHGVKKSFPLPAAARSTCSTSTGSRFRPVGSRCSPAGAAPGRRRS